MTDSSKSSGCPAISSATRAIRRCPSWSGSNEPAKTSMPAAGDVSAEIAVAAGCGRDGSRLACTAGRAQASSSRHDVAGSQQVISTCSSSRSPRAAGDEGERHPLVKRARRSSRSAAATVSSSARDRASLWSTSVATLVAPRPCTATTIRCGPRFGTRDRRLAVTATPIAVAGVAPSPQARCHAITASRLAVCDEQ